MTKTGGWLTTHILDTAHGCPAEGVQIALYRIEAGARRPLAQAVTNSDGRTDAPLIGKGDLESATYELVFSIGDYFRRKIGQEGALFLDDVPIRFAIAQPEEHYHVPLLASPFSYSTYRGS